jgi:hypothetical protein
VTLGTVGRGDRPRHLGEEGSTLDLDRPGGPHAPVRGGMGRRAGTGCAATPASPGGRGLADGVKCQESTPFTLRGSARRHRMCHAASPPKGAGPFRMASTVRSRPHSPVHQIPAMSCPAAQGLTDYGISKVGLASVEMANSISQVEPFMFSWPSGRPARPGWPVSATSQTCVRRPVLLGP